MRFSRGLAHGNVSLVHILLEVKKDMNQKKKELDVPFIASHLFNPDLSLILTVPDYPNKTCPEQITNS